MFTELEIFSFVTCHKNSINVKSNELFLLRIYLDIRQKRKKTQDLRNNLYVLSLMANSNKKVGQGNIWIEIVKESCDCDAFWMVALLLVADYKATKRLLTFCSATHTVYVRETIGLCVRYSRGSQTVVTNQLIQFKPTI